MSDVNANIGVHIDTSAALAELKALQRQLANFHSSIAKNSAASVAAQKGLQNNLLNSINATGKFHASMGLVRSSTESFTHALEGNKLSMREYFRYAGGSTKTFGRLFKQEFDTIGKVAEQRVRKMQTQYIKMGRDANGAMKAMSITPNTINMKDYGTQVAVAAQKQALFNQLMKQGSTNLLNFGKNTQWAGRQLMVGFSVPLLYIGATASKVFMDLEAQAIKFKRVYGDMFTTTADTSKALAEIQLLAKEFTKYGVAVSKTMEMAASAAAMGKTGAELTAQVKEATRLSVLGNVEQQQALETTISLTNAFGISAEELATKIDFLNSVENQTVVSIEDLTIAIPKAGPVIKQLGGNVEDLAFFLTAMKEGGINASEGANALKSGLAAMINPTKKVSAMLAGFGINLNGIVEANKGDIKNTVIGFAQALDTLDPLNRARAIEQLFGKFQFARLSTLFQNITKDGSQASRVLDLAGRSVEELAIISERELKTVEDAVGTNFKESIEQLKLSLAPIGKTFLQAVTPVVKVIGQLLDKFNGLGDGTKKFIVIATALLGVVGPALLMTFGLLANGAANIIKLFLTMRGGFLRLGGNTKILAEQTQYMSVEQLEAATAAASLNQAHTRLTQRFELETAAVRLLRQAYIDATIAGANFAMANPGMMLPGKGGKKPKKFASGIAMVPGTGNKDSVPSILTPGEAVISKDVMEQPNARALVQGLIDGKLQGHRKGVSKVDNSYTHVGKSTSVSTSDFLKNSGLSDYDKARMQFVDGISRGNSGSSGTVNKYPGLGFEFDKSYNARMAKGGVPVADFIKEWEKRGIAKWDLTETRGIIPNQFGSGTKAIDSALIEKIVELSGTKGIVDDHIVQKAFENLPTKIKSNDSYKKMFKEYATAKEYGLGKGLSNIPKIMEEKINKAIRAGTIANAPVQIINGDRTEFNGKKVPLDKYGNAQTLSSVIGKDPNFPIPRGSHVVIERTNSKGKKVVGSIYAYDPNIKQPVFISSGAKTKRQKFGMLPEITSQTSIRKEEKLAAASLPPAENKVLAEREKVKLKLQSVAAGQQKIRAAELEKAPSWIKESEARGAKQYALVQKQGEALLNTKTGETTPLTTKNTKPKPPNAVPSSGNKNDNRLTSITPEQKIIKIPKKFRKVGRFILPGYKDAPSIGAGTVGQLTTEYRSRAEQIRETARRLKVSEGMAKKMLKADGKLMQSKVELAKATQAETQSKIKAQRSGNFGRVSGGIGAVAGMGAMAGYMTGNVGAGNALMGVSAAATIAPMLTNPYVAAGVAVAALGVGLLVLNKKLKDAAVKQARYVESVSASTKKMQQVGELTDKVGASQVATKIREKGTLQSYNEVGRKGEGFGATFLKSEVGKSVNAGVFSSIEKNGAKVAAKELSLQLGAYISDGVLNAEQANSIAQQIGTNLGDMTFTANVEGQLRMLVGPNGEDLLKDPIGVRLNLISQSEQTGNNILSGGIKDNAQAAQLAAYGVQNVELAQAQADAVYMVTQNQINLLEKELLGTTNKERQLAIQKEIAGLTTKQASDSAIMNAQVSKSLDLAMKGYDKVQSNENAGSGFSIEAFTLQQSKSAQKEKAYFDSLKSKVTDRYKDTPFASQAVTVQKDLSRFNDKSKIAGAGFTSHKEGQAFEAKINILMGNGQLNPEQVQSMLNLFEGKLGKLNASLDVGIKTHGAAAEAELSQLLNGMENKTLGAKLFVDISAMNQADFEKTGKAIALIQSMDGSEVNFDITMGKLAANGGEGLRLLSKTLDDIEKLKSPITKEVVADLKTEFPGKAGIQSLDTLTSQFKDFYGLPDQTKKEAISRFLTLYEVNFKDDIAREEYLRKYAGEKAAEATKNLKGPGREFEYQATYQKVLTSLRKDKNGKYLSKEQIAANMSAEQVKTFYGETLKDTPKIPSGGGVDTGKTGPDPYESILKKLKAVRDESINTAGGLKELFRVARDPKTLSSFSGILQQYENKGLNRGFIDYFKELDEKEQKTILTTKDLFDSFNTAFGKIKIGDFQGQQVQVINNIHAQQIALKTLTDAGIDLTDALEMLADAELAVAINSDKSGKSALKAAQDFITAKDALMAQDVSNQLQTPEGTANLYKKYAIDPALQEISATEQLNAAIREASPEYIKETKNIKNQSEAIAKLEHEMSKYQDAISKAQYELDTSTVFGQGILDKISNENSSLTETLALIDRQEASINDKYDLQAEALSKISEINSEIANQQRDQLDLADSLSRGDISGAAKAAQAMRASAAAAAQGRASGTLEAARKTELALVSVNGQTKISVEERQYQLSRENYKIEQLRKVKQDEIAALQATIADIEYNQIASKKASIADSEYLLKLSQDDLDKKNEGITVLGKTKAQWLLLDAEIKNSQSTLEFFNSKLSAAELTIAKSIQAWGTWKPENKTATFTIVNEIINKNITTSGEPDIKSKDPDPKSNNPYVPVGGGDGSENSGGGIGGPNANTSAAWWRAYSASEKMYGGYVKKMASGGYVGGTGMTDKIPTMLTPGEFVVNRAAAKVHGSLLQNLNNSAYPSMAGGNGLTSSNYKQPKTANISAPTISSTTSVNNNSSNLYNYNVGINVTKSDANPNDIARSVIDQIKFVDSQRIRGRK